MIVMVLTMILVIGSDSSSGDCDGADDNDGDTDSSDDLIGIGRISDILENDRLSSLADFSPFSSKVEALLYILLHSPYPIVSRTQHWYNRH